MSSSSLHSPVILPIVMVFKGIYIYKNTLSFQISSSLKRFSSQRYYVETFSKSPLMKLTVDLSKLNDFVIVIVFGFSTDQGAHIKNKSLRINLRTENPKSTTYLEKTKMASEEIDPRPHKY